MANINARALIQETLLKIGTGEEAYRNFLQFSVTQDMHHYDFENLCLIYGQRPEASMLKSYTDWQQNKRYVRRGTKGIATLREDVYGRKYIYMKHDIADTNGRNSPQVWGVTPHIEERLLNTLNTQDLKSYLTKQVEHILYLQKNPEQARVSDILYRSGGDNPEIIYAVGKAIQNSALYAAGSRCGFSMEETQLFPQTGPLPPFFMTWAFFIPVQRTVSGVLEKVERAYWQIIREERKESERIELPGDRGDILSLNLMQQTGSLVAKGSGMDKSSAEQISGQLSFFTDERRTVGYGQRAR